jgi:molybdate transport system permease protein
MSADEWQICWFTLRVAGLATLLILPPGLALALLFARRDFPGKAMAETLVALPLVMPPVATGLLLLKAFGRRGPLGRLLEEGLGWQVVFTWRAVVIAMAVMSLPLLVRSARVAFEEVSPRLEQIARTLGAGEARVFLTITLPLAARGIVAGALLAFARALGEFGATILVAGNIPGRTSTLSLAIYQHVQLGQDGTAFRLLGYAVAIAFLAVWASERVLRRRPAHRASRARVSESP